MRKEAAGAVGAFLLSATSICALAGGDDFVVVQTTVDEVREAKNAFRVARECDNNAACKAALAAASNYFQIPIDRAVTAAAQFDQQTNGEGWHNYMILPSGYVYCDAAMKMVSIVPHDGPRGSLFLGATRGNALYVETWTPVQGLGKGRSWVEAEVTVVGVRQELSNEAVDDGTCQAPKPDRNLWYCRGGGCVDTTDNGQNRSSAQAPGANSRN